MVLAAARPHETIPCVGILLGSEAALRLASESPCLEAIMDKDSPADVIFHHANGMFWIENVTLDSVHINGEPVPQCTVAPLQPEDTLGLGGLAFVAQQVEAGGAVTREQMQKLD